MRVGDILVTTRQAVSGAIGTTRTVRGWVAGRVQGVSYRVSLARRAKVLGLTGWVQNLPDGSVAFLAHGDAAAVDRLLAWAKRGPALARVDRLHTEEVEETPASTSFEIRR